MRIALAIERMDAERGGRETSVAQLACELAARGHAVTILCHNANWCHDDVRIETVGDPGLNLRRAGDLQQFVNAVSEAGKQFDLLHATFPVPGARVYQPRGGTVPGQRTARLRRYGLLRSLALRAGGALSGLLNLRARLERQLVDDPRCEHLAVSKMIAEEYAYHYALSDRVRVVYNAVADPMSRFQGLAEPRAVLREAHGWDGDCVIFLTVATNFRLKGVDEWLRHFARWRKQQGDQSARLLLVGARNLPRYRRQIARLGLQGVARAEGPWSPEQVAKAYAAADVVALLSWYDPCSRVVLEGLRCHLPAITTIFNGAGDVLVKYGCGEVVHSPRHEVGIHAALNRLVDDRNRARLAEACRAAEMELSIERHVDELEQVYTEVIGR